MKGFSAKTDFFIFLLCFYLLVAVVSPGNYKIISSFSPADLLLLLIFAIYLLVNLASSEKRKEFFINTFIFLKKPLSLCCILLFFVMALSTSYATNKGIAISESFRFLTYICLGFIIINEFKIEKHIHYLFNTIFFSAFILDVFGIIQYYTRIGIAMGVTLPGAGFNVRVQSTTGNPNTFGAFLVLTLFPCIVLFLYEKILKKKLIYGALSLLTLVNIILSLSRNSWLALAIGIIVLVFVYNWRFIFVVLTGGIIAYAVPTINGRIKQFTDITQNESRFKIWETALKMIHNHPIFGVGNGNFTSLIDPYMKKYPELYYDGISGYPSHDQYLKIQSELGIPGSLIFLSIMFFSFKNLIFVMRKSSGYYKALYTGIFVSAVSVMFLNLFDNILAIPQVTVLFWIYIFASESIKLNVID